MSVPRESFRWDQGEDKLSSFESSPGKSRFFCSNCGSQMIANREATEYVLIRVGSIDTELKDRPKGHIWRSDGASWYDPEEALPQLPKGAT